MHTNVILTNRRRTHAQSNYTNTKLLAWFRRLLRHPARKNSGSILHPRTHMGTTHTEKQTEGGISISMSVLVVRGQLSLAIPPWVGATSTSESWDVSRHTAWCTSPVSVVWQCKLASGWGLRKRRSAPPYGPYGSGGLYIYSLRTCCRCWRRWLGLRAPVRVSRSSPSCPRRTRRSSPGQTRLRHSATTNTPTHVTARVFYS